jgi:hypothetical protein
MKSCIFTISRNEAFFLPLWVNYYKQFFASSDIIVLDHESNDGSTQNLDVTIETVTNNVVFDHNWLLDTVKKKQVELFEHYDVVVFAEVDEILYGLTAPLNEIIKTFYESDHQYITAHSNEIKQNLSDKTLLVEEHIKPGNLISQRKYWFHCVHYDKSLISKKPLNWVKGFHRVEGEAEYNFQYGLHLVHLHRLDYEINCARNASRVKEKSVETGGDGGQNKITCRDQILTWFNDHPVKLPDQGPLELIPQEHRSALNSLTVF